MKISLLCATLGERPVELAQLITSLNQQTYKDFELIVVSQSHHNRVQDALLDAFFSYIHIESATRGISAARNSGLPYISGEILMLADDDCWYDSGALSVVSEHFKATQASVLCFKHEDPVTRSTYKKYNSAPQHNIGYISLLSLASIDICFNLNKCRELIIFDERFGVGTNQASGEECILLTELKKAGHSIDYYPVTLSYHPTKKLCKTVTREDRITKAAIFERLYGKTLGTVFFLLYLIKNIKYLLKRSNVRGTGLSS